MEDNVQTTGPSIARNIGPKSAETQKEITTNKTTSTANFQKDAVTDSMGDTRKNSHFKQVEKISEENLGLRHDLSPDMELSDEQKVPAPSISVPDSNMEKSMGKLPCVSH